MKADKDFYFKFYAGEFLLDDKVDVLSETAQLLLVKTWCLCCLHGYAPADPVLLAKRVKMDANAVQMHLQSILHFFCMVEGNRLQSPRLEAEREKSGRLSRIRSDAAKSGHQKRKAHSSDAVKDANAGAKPLQLELEKKIDTDTPPTPPAAQGGQKPGRKGRRTRAEIVMGFLPETQAVVNTLGPVWPKEQPDGSPIRLDVGLFAQAVEAILARRIPGITPEVLIEAGRMHFANARKAYKAPQWYFSTKDADENQWPWLGNARLAYRKLHPQPPATPPPPTPPPAAPASDVAHG